MNHRESSQRETVLFIAGLVSALIPWGLGMIGVAINLWLGGTILAAAFLLMAYAFWIWVRSLKWHIALRLIVVAVAGAFYLGLVRHQIVSEVNKRNPPERQHTVQSRDLAQLKPVPATETVMKCQRNDKRKRRVQKQPLVLSFANTSNLEWRITNESGGVVENATYCFVISDIDQPHLKDIIGGASLPVSPIQIPVQKVDFVNPHDSAGGTVFPFEISQRLRIGDRLFGAASLNCPGCKERGYWLYLKWGQVGWFSEMRGYNTRGLKVPIGQVIDNPAQELEQLAPMASRVTIR